MKVGHTYSFCKDQTKNIVLKCWTRIQLYAKFSTLWFISNECKLKKDRSSILAVGSEKLFHSEM